MPIKHNLPVDSPVLKPLHLHAAEEQLMITQYRRAHDELNSVQRTDGANTLLELETRQIVLCTTPIGAPGLVP